MKKGIRVVDDDELDESEEVGLSPTDSADITPEQYAAHLTDLLEKKLNATSTFEVVEKQSGVGQIHFLGRVRKDALAAYETKIVDPLLQAFSEDPACTLFIGTQRILKSNRKLYAHVISFFSSDLKRVFDTFCSICEAAYSPSEVVEAPLLGARPPQSGGLRTGRRGASPLS